MSTITLLVPQTAAVTTAIPFDSAAYPYLTLSADNLGPAETVTVFQAITSPSGGTLLSPAINTNGAPAALTSTLPAVNLNGGAPFAFTKSATAAACGVYMRIGGRLW